MILLNGQELHFKTFPNGETLVDEKEIIEIWKINRLGKKVITFKYENDSDLIKLLFIKKYMDTYFNDIKLKILYMPYSRMDRIEGYSAFTLKYIAEFINSMNFSRVEIIEPHSDVTSALINNCKVEFPTIKMFNDVKNIFEFNENEDYAYFPDAGADKRYSNLIKVNNQLVGFKHRDFETGRITSLQVIGETDLTGKKVIMIDDLCSRGGTFMLGAEQLKKMGASEIYLVVGHCEDTIFDGDILKTDLINKVFTTKSIINKTHEKIKIYEI